MASSYTYSYSAIVMMIQGLLCISLVSKLEISQAWSIHKLPLTRKFDTYHDQRSDLSMKDTSWNRARTRFSSNLFATNTKKQDSQKENTSSATDRLLTQDQEEFFASLDAQVYGEAFIERLRDLQEYQNKFGTCHVPKRYPENPTLGNWVNKTRQMYRKYQKGEQSSMTKERIDILIKVGFVWYGITKRSNGNHAFQDSNSPPQSNEHIWENNFNQIKSYMEENDGMAASLATTTKLGVWAARQRREYQKMQSGERTTMTKERADLLESIGFDWCPWDTKWKLRLQELEEYKAIHGDCLVPVQYKENPKLGRWVSTQRKYYKLYQEGKPTQISGERIKELTDIGFIWDRWEHLWKDCEDECNVS